MYGVCGVNGNIRNLGFRVGVRIAHIPPKIPPYNLYGGIFFDIKCCFMV